MKISLTHMNANKLLMSVQNQVPQGIHKQEQSPNSAQGVKEQQQSAYFDDLCHELLHKASFLKEKKGVRFSALYLQKKRNLLVFDHSHQHFSYFPMLVPLLSGSTDWDFLFQPLFDELLTPPPSVDYPAPEFVAPIHEVVAPGPAISTGSPSSTNVDQDAPSPMAKSKDFVYLLDNYPHDWLFLQCAVVVHHGGARTTAAGLKAAGVGPPPILVEEFSLKKLVSAIEFMFKPVVKVSATELAKTMAYENGVKGAVDAFHKHFACRKAKPEPAELPRMPNHFSMRRSLGDLINKGDFQLAWIFRLKIAIGITQGLPYLHKDYVPHLLHRDVKSRNVLLNNEFKPKLTDLALDTILGENAFRSSLDSKSGSSCYIAPGSKTMQNAEFLGQQKALRTHMRHICVRRKVNISNGSVQVLDQKNSSSCKQEALGMLEIALQCTSVVLEKQPSIWEVVAALQFLGWQDSKS
ncbi:probably inactive leucine-rich repeat receptor-like protein kinase [Tanacetum coccineum]